MGGIEYLERYFVIIAFASWLDSDAYQNGVGSFYQWFKARTHLKELKRTIRTNPGAALSPMLLPQTPSLKAGAGPVDVHVVLGQEHKVCLSSRTGVMLKRNTILKSYLFPQMQIKALKQLPGVFNFLEADQVPIASASAPS